MHFYQFQLFLGLFRKKNIFVEKSRAEIRVIRPNLGLRCATSSTPLSAPLRGCFPTLASSGRSWPWQLAARGNDVIANEHAQLQTQPHLVSAIADGARPFMLLDLAA